MIDPPDRLIKDYVEGTDTVDGDGTGEWGRRQAGEQRLYPNPPSLYRQFFQVLTANQPVTFFLDDRPDFWCVKVSNIASNGALIYPYNGAMGPPFLMDAGDYQKIPGISEYLTIVANATGATVSVQAVRGHVATM